MVRISDCGLFQDLDAGVLKEIEALATERQYGADEAVYAEGDQASELFVLADGEVELSFTVPGHPEALHVAIRRVLPGEV